MFVFNSMLDPSEADKPAKKPAGKCLLASGEFDVYLSKQHVNSALFIGSLFFHSMFDVRRSMFDVHLFHPA
jgi:hypothetical protein